MGNFPLAIAQICHSEEVKPMQSQSPTVYAVIQVKIKNPKKFGEYVQGHLPSVFQYGGKFALEVAKTKDIEGTADWDFIVVQEWPTEESFNQWWDSPEYKPWKDMRPEGAEVKVTLSKNLH